MSASFKRTPNTDSPKPRCRGHCCKCFSTENSYDEILQDYRNYQKDPTLSKIKDVEKIAPMLIPLGKVRGQEIFTCKHLSKEGNCTVYETRPQMCRDFPGNMPCPYRNCASHGPQNRIKKMINWVLD